MEDSTGESSTRVDIAGGWFLNWFLNWFLDRGWGRGLRRLGQSWLLPEEEWAYQQDSRQQQSPVKNASVHISTVPTQRMLRSITRGEASA
jgi:hypothetical protein